MISVARSLQRRIKLWGTYSWIALVLAFAAAVVYLSFSVHFAITQRSTIDEGLFLYKGYLFTTGAYQPFQEYGPRMIYGPLSYLFPGTIQLWFGPGLLTGRVFAIIVGALGLIGLWASARRLAGPWWATSVVWVAALNPAAIRFYSIGLSQGLVACLLMWTLFFVLGRNRSAFQTSMSAILAGLLLLTRQNMVPVLPILSAYIFWQFGRKQGLISTLAGAITVTLGHIIFWPGILAMWAPWLPAGLTPFLSNWRLPEGITAAMIFHPTWLARLYSLLEGFRFHFIALAGSIIGLAFWPARRTWINNHQFRSGLFLAVLFFSLLVLNTWGGLGFNKGNNSNAFTFNPYLAFFTYVGLLFLIAVFSSFKGHLSSARQIIICLLVVLISTGIGYGGYENTGGILLDFRIPRIKSFFLTGNILPGNVPLWDFLDNKFSLTYDIARWLIPLLAGFLSGLLVLVLGYFIWSFLKRRRVAQPLSFGAITGTVFILTGILLSPSVVLGGGFNQWECNQNVINTYEQAGHELAELLLPGDLIYWDGGNALAVLLYTGGNRIQPQELDGQWNLYLDGDPETLSRLGYWNIDLAEQWRQEADVIIVQNGFFDSDLQTFFDPKEYPGSFRTNEFLNCTPDSFLQVYRRSN